MKFIVFLLISFAVQAQEITFNESMNVLDQHADSLSKVEVGLQLLNETYVMKPDCVDRTSTTSTIVEIKNDVALVLNEKKITSCTGVIETSKFLTHDTLISLPALKTEMLKRLQGFKAERKNNIITWKGHIGASEFTFQYDLNSNLFVNWVHHHRSDPGSVENHNIKYPLAKRIITQSEIEGLKFCDRDPLTLTFLKCN